MLLFNLKFYVVAFAAANLLGCSSPSQGANEAVSSGNDKMLADEQYLEALKDEFLEISGKDYVEFNKGSSALNPTAEFRLERQALWLRSYPMVSIRLVASGDGLERVPDRRLAMARASAVQNYLALVGIDEHQISGIDVEPPQSGNRKRVVTKIDLIQPVRDE